MATPQSVLTLVENFERNLDAYRSGKYNETQVRRDFIDPFFKALGWDMDNSAGYAEAYRDVIHEDAIKIGNSVKAPDYSFRIGGQRKFFLEAKKPSVNVKDDVEPAFQLRRYAWSAKLPLSIVTDFEEFAIYDCRAKPNKGDKASKARLFYCTFRDYAEKWDEIAAIFSKDAVLKGSFDKYATTSKGKRGTSEVDGAFLEEIEGWRDLLARNIALRNPGLTQRELNFAVQQTIDRIIFLRICEDRGIEPYGRLMALQNGVNVYGRLRGMFRDADDRYNSGLFHFKREKGRAEAPDELTLNLEIDDKPLKEIFKNLYYPDCPYEFSVLGADILGQVYEQFLGKVIRLTAGHHAVVEDKPEVKKAGGVFYTPAYIVQYIVLHTVGKLLEDKTPKQVKGISILDPACGSGSFLIGAYQYLLDWYLARYVEEGAEKHSKGKEARLRHSTAGEWRLTTAEKKRILLEHIYGVDIDAQAVEVTKLSLLLKMLEGESDETLNSQMKLFHERVLPDLEHNIQCGNSLIGPNFYDGQLDLDDEVTQRINVFDWQAAFQQVFKAGGFDAVIGNPPYLNVDDTWGKDDPRLQALKDQYPQVYNDKTDILFYFLAKAIQLSKGYASYIVSRSFLEAYKADKLRKYLSENTAINEIIDFQNYHVFAGVGITTCIVNFACNQKPRQITTYKLRQNTLPFFDLAKLLDDTLLFEKIQTPQANVNAAPWVFVSESIASLNEKIDQFGVPLEKVLVIGQGMQTGLNEIFGERTLDEIQRWQAPKDMYYKRAANSDIQRYFIRDRGEYLLYLENVPAYNKTPKGIQKHLQENEEKLKSRAAYKRGNCEWWRYTWPLHKEYYDRPRILCPYLASDNRFALDTEQQFLSLTDSTVLFESKQPESLLYLLGLLNSKTLTFRFKSIGKLKSGGILEYFWNSISKLPIRRIDFKNTQDVASHTKMVALVEKMLALHQQLAAAKTPQDATLLQRQIDATDRQIDQLVYQLYGLTDEEIVLVEGVK